MKIKHENGITIMTLVITIVIMLILVGVTISMVTETDIFGRTEDLKIRTEFSELVDEWYTRRAEINMRGIPDEEIVYYDIKSAVIVIGQTELTEQVIRTVEISDELNKKIAIVGGKIVYYPTECTEKEIEYFETQDVRPYSITLEFTNILTTWTNQMAKLSVQGIDTTTLNFTNVQEASYINAAGYKTSIFFDIEISKELLKKIEVKNGAIVYKADKCTTSEIEMFKSKAIKEINEV